MEGLCSAESGRRGPWALSTPPVLPRPSVPHTFHGSFCSGDETRPQEGREETISFKAGCPAQ